MYCDNCGDKVDDDAAFCAKCGQQLLPQKAPVGIPPPTRTPHLKPRRHRSQGDFLCFGEDENESPWTGGIVLICIGIFLAVIFWAPDFPIEILIVLGFFLFGVIAIIQGLRKDRKRG